MNGCSHTNYENRTCEGDPHPGAPSEHIGAVGVFTDASHY